MPTRKANVYGARRQASRVNPSNSHKTLIKELRVVERGGLQICSLIGNDVIVKYL